MERDSWNPSRGTACSTDVVFARTVLAPVPDAVAGPLTAFLLHSLSFDSNALKLNLIPAGTLGALVLSSFAAAQATIYGLDVRGMRFFTTDVQNFVANFMAIGPNSIPVFGLDFDATATTVWGVQNPVPAGSPVPYGTFNLTTGVFTAVGNLTGPANVSG